MLGENMVDSIVCCFNIYMFWNVGCLFWCGGVVWIKVVVFIEGDEFGVNVSYVDFYIWIYFLLNMNVVIKFFLMNDLKIWLNLMW